MLYKRFSIISIVLALSLLSLTACGSGLPHNVQQLAQQGANAAADSITIYVITRYEMSEIVADSARYSNWRQLLQAEFDGSDRNRATIVWRGDYVLSVGILQADNANDIMVYYNGKYSDLFVLNCPYAAGSVLAFVERGVDMQTLNKLLAH